MEILLRIHVRRFYHWGFTQTHLNGTGCMDLGDILVMPFTGQRHRAWDAYRSSFQKILKALLPVIIPLHSIKQT